MRSTILLILAVLLIGINSCKKDDEIPPEVFEPDNGGIVMSFDDNFINEWYEADSVLKDYNWKATFCISSYSRLSLNEIQKLHDLADAGHEIAGKGLRHLDAVKYIDSLGAEEYLNKDIYPMLELMEHDGFNVKSFAYPFGRRNEETDQVLLTVFDILRGVGRGSNYTAAARNSFFVGSPVVYGFEIDEHTSYFDGLEYEQCLLDVLTYARDNKEILLVFGHRTVENVTDQYETSFSALELICKFVNDNDMKFYTLSDLKGMVNQ